MNRGAGEGEVGTWTRHAHERLRVLFPDGGARAVQRELPDFSLLEIRREARRQKIHRNRPTRDKLKPSLVRKALRTAAGKLVHAARKLKVPSATFSRHAKRHGLIEHKPKPHWTGRELALLQRAIAAGVDPDPADFTDRSPAAVRKQHARMRRQRQPKTGR